MSSARTHAAASGVAGLVLAAGKGTRMRSALPKVLHEVAGRPRLEWTLRCLDDAGIDKICLVLSEDRGGFAPFLAKWPDLNVAVQRNRQGTGDAVAAAAWSLAGVQPPPFAAGYAAQGQPLECSYLLIMAGDVPAVQAASLRDFVAAAKASAVPMAVLGMQMADPTGYGRMRISSDVLQDITEEKDADVATRSIDICNTGIYLVDKQLLFALLPGLKPQNAQGEYYLTDCVKLARSQGHRVLAHVASESGQFAGINDRAQLAAVEAMMIRRKRQELLAAGVGLQLPETIYVEPGVEVGNDTLVAAGCHLSGVTRIGRGCVIGAGSILKNIVVPSGEHVPPHTVRIQAEA